MIVKRRTSEICVLVPAGKYLQNPRYQTEILPNPENAWIVREVDVAWDVSQRAAVWLSKSCRHNDCYG